MKKSDKIKKSLLYSILDGTFFSMMVGFGESFFSAFGVFLKATNFQLGLLTALPQSIGSITQLLSNTLLKVFKSRKRLIYFFALLQGLMYIPIALVFFFGEFKVFHLIVFICLYWILGMMIGPAWNSWMGDLVPEKQRGFYFGKRNRIGGFASFVSLLAAGYILQRFSDGTTTQYIGFAIIFALALISRIISFIYLTKKYEPRFQITPKAEFSFIDFLRQARFNNYGLLVLYLSFMNYAVYLSAPFFTAYMLYDLKLSYMSFTIVTAAALIVKFLSMPIWGRASDKYGTRKILSLTGFLMPLVPLLWLIHHEVWYLILIQIYSGFVWGGFEISSSNFIFDATIAPQRATCIAYYNVLNGIFIFIGAIFGSLIVRYNHLFWSKYLFVFLISGLLRYMVSFVFIPKLKEVRPVEHIPYPELFLRIISTMTTQGLHYEYITFKRRYLK